MIISGVCPQILDLIGTSLVIESSPS